MTWTRRKFVQAGLGVVAGLGFGDALWAEKFFIETNEFSFGAFSKNSTKITVVQVSDLHLQTINYQLRQLAKKLNSLQPDLILFTGDALDDSKKTTVLNDFLRLISYSIKKVAILGNWEYWGNIDLVLLKKIYRNNNCDLLINETQQYTFAGKTISITGVDDYVGGNADMAQALQLYQQSDYHVVLNHCPEYSDILYGVSAARVPIDFVLAGHTHGGQVNLFGFVPFKPQGSGRYLKGWYRDGAKQMYVSKGIGTSILPVRFMARAEIALFNLYS